MGDTPPPLKTADVLNGWSLSTVLHLLCIYRVLNRTTELELTRASGHCHLYTPAQGGIGQVDQVRYIIFKSFFSCCLFYSQQDIVIAINVQA